MTAPTERAHGDGGALVEAEFTIKAITIIVASIAGSAFLFGFGNCWALGIRLGVPGWIAPLVGPAVDLSVVGLLLAWRFLALHGASAVELAPIKRMLIASCVATLTLNTAEPIVAGQYGKAAFDSVAPLMLMGWSEIAPGLLAAIRQIPVTARASSIAGDPSTPVVAKAITQLDSDQDELPVSPHSQDAPEHVLMQAARDADAGYWREHRRPIPADKLREELGIGSARARALVRSVRDEYPVAAPLPADGGCIAAAA